MNEIKKVNFEGDELLAIKDEETGKIYVSVKTICEGIGLSEGQIKSERKRLKEDFVLHKGGRNFILPTNGGNQDTVCIEVDYLPLWLAKISITPKMIEEKPEVANKLADYQLKAKDVLAKVFIHKEEITKEDLLILGIVKSKDTTQQALAIKEYGDFIKEEENKRLTNEIINPLRRDLEHSEDVLMSLTTDISLMEKRQRISQIVKYNTKKYAERYNLLYEEFDRKFHVDTKRRLENGKERGEIKKSVNRMEYICSEKYLNKTNELYDVAVKVFEGDFIKLLDEWKDNITN